MWQQPGTLCLLITFATSSMTAFAAHAQQTAGTESAPDSIEEIMVLGRRDKSGEEPTELTRQLLKVPGTFGDPFAAVFTLPGVVEESEGDGQPAVRGTGPEDNAFLIDYLPASYVFHDLGQSIFNEHLIQDFGLHAAGFGPEYAQATGAVFDITLREPRKQMLATTLDLSFLRTGFLLEGQLAEKHAFYIAGRQSLIHLLLKAIDEDIEEEDDITFSRKPKWHDYQAKYSWTPNDNNRISLLALGSDDSASLSFGSRSEEALLDPGSLGRADLDTSFQSQSLLWDFDNGSNSARFGAGRLVEKTEQRLGDGRDRIEVKSTSWTARGEVRHTLNENHSLRIGGEARRRTYNYDLSFRYTSCTRFDPACEEPTGEVLTLADKQRVDTFAGFVQYQWKVSDALHLSPGIRYAHNKYLNKSRTQPRLSATYNASDRLTFTSSYGKYHQQPFIAEFAPEVGNPDIESPEATHYVAGFDWQPNDRWVAGLDVYYKDLDKLIVNVDDARNYVNAATGEAYGAELMIKRELTNRWYGWASVSWAKSKRTNNLTDTSFVADHDTPIVVNLVANYKWNKWNFGARWNLRSGSPYTTITGNRENPDFSGAYLPVYGELNSKRADAFHRLDLRAERSFGWGRMNGSYYFDVINAYGAKNTGEVYYEPVANSAEFELKKEKGLPVLPSIGVTVTF